MKHNKIVVNGRDYRTFETLPSRRYPETTRSVRAIGCDTDPLSHESRLHKTYVFT